MMEHIPGKYMFPESFRASCAPWQCRYRGVICLLHNRLNVINFIRNPDMFCSFVFFFVLVPGERNAVVVMPFSIDRWHFFIITNSSLRLPSFRGIISLRFAHFPFIISPFLLGTTEGTDKIFLLAFFPPVACLFYADFFSSSFPAVCLFHPCFRSWRSFFLPVRFFVLLWFICSAFLCRFISGKRWISIREAGALPS